MKKQKGITLIALVISIIVMLILAGVSINAIVGENGVLSRAQYSSFMSEMAAVEEAVQLWKAGELMESKGQSNTAIPANGLCKVNDLTAAERLVGEIGYYRTWSIGKSMPDMSILSSAEDFNKKYEGEFIFYPAGVQDLYYLNNEALDLDKDKMYLIDASTSIVYSTTGITLNGVRCHSTSMAKAIMGNNVAPIFEEAEISGGGDNIVYAGETYLKDKNGNYIDENGNIVSEENKVLNPYGFQLIASGDSKNVFKLYNNGDLYGKGVKGIQLNTSQEEMDAINQYVWNELSLPSQISSYKKIYPTEAGMFLIDNNDDVWSINNNYGLTDEQRVEYTGRTWIKLDLGKSSTGLIYKAKKIFGTECAVYIVTTTNELLGTGTNQYGQLGCNDKTNKTTFVPIYGVENPSSIEMITGNNYNGEGGTTIIKCVDESNNKHFYFCGVDLFGGLGFGVPRNITSTTFIEIYNGETGRGNNIANEIKNIYAGYFENALIWFENGEIYFTGWSSKFTLGKWDLPKVVDVRWSTNLIVLKCDNNGITEYYGTTGSSKVYALGEGYVNNGIPKLIEFPNGVEIKDFNIINGSACFFLSTTGDLYAMGYKSYFGNKEDINGWTTDGMIKLDSISGIDSFYGSDFDVIHQEHGQLFLNKNGKYYLTCNSNIMYGDDILQKTWTKVASNVAYFDASNTAYVTKDHNVYVAGKDSRKLGLGEISETQVAINNYTQVTQSEIVGKAQKVYQMNGATYILTTDNKLYGTGLSQEDNGTHNYCGWDYKDANGKWVYENKNTYVLIKENVKIFISREQYYPAKAIITNDNKLYAIGNYRVFAGLTPNDFREFTEFAFPTILGNVENIKKWLYGSSFRSFLLGKDGKMYMAGTWNNVFNGGVSNKRYEFEEFTYGMELQSEETIIDIANLGSDNCMMLTSNGRLFGFGNACYMGINRTDSTLMNNQLIQSSEINGKKLTQIVGGQNWYLAVDEDGKVYGTGKNEFGVLGR